MGRSLYAEVLEERVGGRESLAMSLPGILDGPPRRHVRDANVERQASIQDDLAIKQFERRRDRKAEIVKDALGLGLDVGADSSPGRCCFDGTHCFTSI